MITLLADDVELLHWHDLSCTQQNDLYAEYESEELEEDYYFEFDGQLHRMADFLREESHTEASEAGWQASYAESAFSRLLLKMECSGDTITLGRES